MRCRLFLISLALSLNLCLMTAVMWARSYSASYGVGRIHYAPGIDTEDHHVWVSTDRGIFEIVGGGDPIENFSDVRWEWRRLSTKNYPTLYKGDEPPFFRSLGITWEKLKRLLTWEITWNVRFHMGLPTSLFALGAAFSFVRLKRIRHDVSQGLCRVCGYDLRATPDRCPECGTVAGHVDRGRSYPTTRAPACPGTDTRVEKVTV
jgi:hypothetical protein